MTDKDILDFCKAHDVEINIRFDPDVDSYHLQMRRGWLLINYIFSPECLNNTTAWNIIVKSKLNELVDELTRLENSREAEKESLRAYLREYL